MDILFYALDSLIYKLFVGFFIQFWPNLFYFDLRGGDPPKF